MRVKANENQGASPTTVYDRPTQGRTDLNKLLSRVKEEQKQDKRAEMLVISAVVLLIAIFIIIFAL